MAVTDRAADPPSRPLTALPRYELAWVVDEDRHQATVYSPHPEERSTQWISVDADWAVALDAIA